MSTETLIKTRLNMALFARLAWISYLRPDKIIDALRQYFPRYKFDIVTIQNDYYIVDTMAHGDTHKTRIIIFRGTDFNNLTGHRLRDLADDLGIFLNNEGFIERLARIKHEIKKYITPHMFLVGHSLGGYVGARMSKYYKKKARLFNIGSSPINHVTDTNADVVHYTTNHIRGRVVDPLSIAAVALDKYRTIHVPVKKGLRPHTIDNFV